MFLTTFANRARISSRTKTTIPFVGETSLAGRFIIAGITWARILRTKKFRAHKIMTFLLEFFNCNDLFMFFKSFDRYYCIR